jgi:hypothetical protein
MDNDIYGEGKENAFRRLNREWKYRLDELSQATSNYTKQLGALLQTLKGHSGRVCCNPLTNFSDLSIGCVHTT